MNTGTLTLTPKERWSVLSRDSFTCQYCGAKAPEARLHVDHVIPRAMGGTNDERNLITSCEPCNVGKRDRPLLKYWFVGGNYSAAGMAVEEIMERYGKRCSSLLIFELMQLVLGADKPYLAHHEITSAESFEAVQALIAKAMGDEDEGTLIQ